MNEQIQWLSTIIAFFSGIGLTLVGALVAYYFQRRGEKQKQFEQTRFDIYMKLMELYGLYFWVYSAEVRNEKLDYQIKNKIKDLAWQISDSLRVADTLDCMPQVLDVLFGSSYKDAEARYFAMQELLGKLSKSINPRFSKAIKQVGQTNARAVLEDPARNTNAPEYL